MLKQHFTYNSNKKKELLHWSQQLYLKPTPLQPSLLLEDHVVETVKQYANPVAETVRDLRC
jgi:hypothetical protein